MRRTSGRDCNLSQVREDLESVGLVCESFPSFFSQKSHQRANPKTRRERVKRMKILGVIFCFTVCQRQSYSQGEESVQSFVGLLGSPVEIACSQMVTSEGFCLASLPDTKSCPSLVSNLRSLVRPIEKGTDPLLRMYFHCFTEANLRFNIEIGCSAGSFSQVREYRRAQRLGNTNASFFWKIRMEDCRKNPFPKDEQEGVGSGVYLIEDPFAL